MKKSFNVFALSLVAVSALFSCSKEIDVINDKPAVEGNKTILTINATNPESVATKTTMVGTTPSWLAGDKITVIYKNNSDAVATAESTPLGSNSSSASFEAELVDANTSINGYAVYPANALSQTLSVAKIPIAAEQHPTGTAFDGTSDIMVSEAFTPAGTVSTRFARLGAILRVKISNATLNDEKILNLSVTAESNLVGNASVNLSDASLSGLSNGNTTVTATYEPANQFTVGAAEKYVYLIVYPQELAASSTLTISGETENYSFSKAISLPNKIVLNPGHIVPLNIAVADPVLKDKVFFEERFTESTGTMGWSGSAGNGTFNTENTWTTNNAYGAGGSAKFGTGSKLGDATTSGISISPAIYKSQAIKLSFKAGAWNNASENTTLKLTATNCNLKSSGTTVSSVDMVKGEWTEFILDVTDIDGNITIKFEGNEASNSRFFLDDVCIYYGAKPIEKSSPELAFSPSTAQAYLGETASFTEPTLTNEHGVAVTYESDNTDIAEVASDGQVTLKAAGTANISAVFAGNASYRAQTVSYALTVKTPTLSISPSGNILLGGAANSVKSITITATHAWTATLNATATSARGTSFSVLNSSDSVIDGAITGTEGVTTIKFKALGDGDPSEESSYGTITITDNLYAGATSGAINIKQSSKGATTWSRVTSIATLLAGGTFIMGYEADAKSGIIIPLRSKDSNATTSANGYFNTGTKDGSSTSGTIDMSDLSDVTTSDYEVYITESSTSGRINIQRVDDSGNYYGATSGGTTSNKGRLYTSGSTNETNLLPEWSSESDNQFKLTAGVSGSYKHLKYNTGSPRFAFYNSAGEKIVFYKKD